MKTNRRTGKKTSVALLSGALLFFACLIFTPDAKALTTPTIVKPVDGYIVPPDTRLRVSGFVAKGATVYVFVDAKLVGGVKAKKTNSPTATFVYVFKKSLSSGKHTLHIQAAIGKDKSVYTEKRSLTIPATWPRRIDGVRVAAPKANLLPVAVMIENLSSVRPQAGLASASLVYETLAEGGIPRFMALFAREDMKRVGPVRSSRPYFVDWAKEYQGPYLHAGGSRDALNEIGKQRVRSVDALVRKTAKYFFRVGSRASTHNLFTSGKVIQQYKKDIGLADAKTTFRSWLFKDDLKLAKRPQTAEQLTIDFRSGAAYIVRYQYDRASNSWLRFNGGRPHLDANYPKATQIKAKNVIVQLTKKERVMDSKGRLDLTITGEGNGWLLQDGTLAKISWKKPKAESRTIYYRQNGSEVVFNRGTTWIEAVPSNRPVLWQ